MFYFEVTFYLVPFKSGLRDDMGTRCPGGIREATRKLTFAGCRAWALPTRGACAWVPPRVSVA